MSVSLTTRLSLTQWSAGADPVTRAQFNAAFLSLEEKAAIASEGLFAALPAAGTRGRFYLATDTGALYYDTGSTWVTITALSHIASTVAHGATGAVVGTTNTQVLTNKTMDGASNTFTNIPWAAIAGGPSSDLVYVNKAASFTPDLVDSHKVHLADHATVAIGITLPSDGTRNFPIGSTIPVSAEGVADVYFIQGAGASVAGTPGLYLRTRYSFATAHKIASNTWRVTGDLR